jgi:fatty acid desaturase
MELAWHKLAASRSTMLPSTQSEARFSITQARSLVKDLFIPNPWIYWADFSASLTVGGICFALVRRVAMFSPQQGLLFVFSGVLYYRAALFIHELAHLRENTFRVFRIVWNLLCGIPFLMPSFLYYTHVDHHMRRHFGTDQDGEYLPLGTQSTRHLMLYLCQPFIIPLLAVVRFMVLAPLSWFSPAARRLIQQRASSMVMDPSYVRPLPTRKALRVFRLQEVACFLVTIWVAAMLIRGRWPLLMLVQMYATAVLIILINHIRTLGAHRYTNAGGEMSFLEQLLDSVNYPSRPWVSGLWGPIGLRFHALHHLFPSLPYHALGQAHRRLVQHLPSDSPYRLTESPSLTASLRQLWQRTRQVAESQRRERNSAFSTTREEMALGKEASGT